MKKRSLHIFLFFLIFIPFIQTSAQEIQIVVGDTVVYGDPGASELVLYAHVINISSVNQTVFLVRTENNLPANWTSALCFDVNCYPPFTDSVATTEPLVPGDTVEASVHFIPDPTIPGTGHVQIQIGTFHNPGERTTINLTASTEPSAVDNENYLVDDFKVYQNYPNPFNPSTTISYAIPHRSNVILKVYNITGNEVASLVNEVQEPGSYSVHFNAEKLSSGVYFYRVTAGTFSSVRKMILIK